MKKNQGFTLIELMIVIAIIAILMAYAIPAYRDYTVRAKAGEGIAIAAAAKQAVSETYISEGEWPDSNPAAGLPAAGTITGENVASVTVTDPGVITILFNGNDSVLTASSNIVLTPTSATGAGSITWACTSNLDNRYLPTDCRTASP